MSEQRRHPAWCEDVEHLPDGLHRAYLASLPLDGTAVGVTIAGTGAGQPQVELTVTTREAVAVLLSMRQAHQLGSALLDAVRRYA